MIPRPRPAVPQPDSGGRARPGQALVMSALLMIVLLGMTGLAVDVGVWLVAKSRLQRAVDAAALSVVLDRPLVADTDDSPLPGVKRATERSRTIITDQGIPVSDLRLVRTGIPLNPSTGRPLSNRLAVEAQQRVPTTFARVVGVNWADISVRATADINSFIEIPVNPICIASVNAVCDGMVGDSTMDAFGISRPPKYGDAYENPSGPWYRDRNGNVVLPNGYQYRVQIEKDYRGTLVIQGWDLDGFNRDNPPKCRRPDTSTYTPGGNPPAACGLGESVVGDWSKLEASGQINPEWRDPNYGDFPAVISSEYGAGLHKFYRIDECNNEGNDYPCYDPRAQTPLQFTFWTLDPDALDPWNPSTGPGGERRDLATVTVCAFGSATAPCTITYECLRPNGDQDSCIDMTWLEIFRLDVSTIRPSADGSRSLYVDVKPLGNTKGENAYNLRSGPPPGSAAQASCRSGAWALVGGRVAGRSNWEHVNDQANAACRWSNSQGAANTNTKIFARRSMPLNVVAAGQRTPYRVYLGWIPKEAARQTLRLRNYDLDSASFDGLSCDTSRHMVEYKAYFPGSGRDGIPVTTYCGSGGAHDSGTPGVDSYLEEDWAEFKYGIRPLSDAFWRDGSGTTEAGFWLYAEVFQKGSPTSPFWDTTVWEVLFDRARLVR